jgi:hypothetical protein
MKKYFNQYLFFSSKTKEIKLKEKVIRYKLIKLVYQNKLKSLWEKEKSYQTGFFINMNL